MRETINFFVIYTRENSAFLLQLLPHLDSLKKDFTISFWYDDPIDPKKEWSPQIESRFEDADVYLLLVDNTLMYSKFMEQLEFKMLVDKYKAGKSKVIPIILEDCPWDINFEGEDYSFSLNELPVLPESRKPISHWDSVNKAMSKCLIQLRSILTIGGKNYKPAEFFEDEEKKHTNTVKEDRIEPPISTERRDEKKLKSEGKEELVVQNKTVVKIKSSNQNRARKHALKETRNKTSKSKKDAKTKVKPENSFQENSSAKNRFIKELKLTPDKITGLLQHAKKGFRRRKVLLGVSVVVLLIVAVALSSKMNSRASETAQTNLTAATTSPTNNSEDESKKQNVGAAGSMVKFEIGNTYRDGIIFEMDDTSKNGIIAHIEDTEPMIWKEAIKIHEKLGEGWRLPTIDELVRMQETIGQGANNSGEFADELYWSATPYDENQARVVRFSDGNSTYHYNSRGTHRQFLVRAVRDFSR